MSSKRIPKDLDPRTLRWVADLEIEEAERCEQPLPDWMGPQTIAFWTQRAKERRQAARLLRSLATRIERRRSGGGK